MDVAKPIKIIDLLKSLINKKYYNKEYINKKIILIKSEYNTNIVSHHTQFLSKKLIIDLEKDSFEYIIPENMNPRVHI